MASDSRPALQDEPASQIEATGEELAALVGPSDANRKLIESLLGVRLVVRHGHASIFASPEEAQKAAALLQGLLGLIRKGRGLSTSDIRFAVRQATRDHTADIAQVLTSQVVVTHRGKPVAPKTPGQALYVKAMASHDLTICIGPAGTGKTYLAMAMAVAALRDGVASRVVLTRPIVEAGESLGFLPGDILEKVAPYLRPLQDALHDIMGAERFRRLTERDTIEVIPLAYMRGRTLNDAFVVLDEGQNTTPGQMKMALTRLGFGSKMVVTGDVTQTDLPHSQVSGLRHACDVLEGVRGIAFCRLTGEDIVRHDLVQRIVAAYDQHKGAGDVRDEKAAQG